MSTTLLRAVMALPKEALPSSPRHVLTVLAWHCNEKAVRRGDRRCWPSLNTLSMETSLDRNTCMRAIDFLEHRRFSDIERRQRVGNCYRLTDPKTWPIGGIAQPGPGSTAQPDPDRVPPPERVREMLRDFTNQVAWRNQPGCMVRPEQEFQNSKQEEPEERIARAQDDGAILARAQNNALAVRCRHDDQNAEVADTLAAPKAYRVNK